MLLFCVSIPMQGEGWGGGFPGFLGGGGMGDWEGGSTARTRTGDPSQQEPGQVQDAPWAVRLLWNHTGGLPCYLVSPLFCEK